jgi:hypothetical protein
MMMSSNLSINDGSGSEIDNGVSLENLSLRGGGRGSSRARGQAAVKAAVKAAAKKGSQNHGVQKKIDFNQKRACNIPAAALALLSAAKG